MRAGRDILAICGHALAVFSVLICSSSLGAGSRPAGSPASVWSATRSERLETALDAFFAETDPNRQRVIFDKELSPRGVGLTLLELQAMAKAQPPSGDKRGRRGLWRVACPWLADNERGWFHLTMPAGYTPKKAWPLAIALHGSGSDGGNVVSFYSPRLNKRGFFVVYPTTTSKAHSWATPAEVINVYRIIDWAARRYRVDFRRLAVTGGSMGGMGTWSHLLMRPELWSCGASVAGHPAALKGEVLENLRGVPFYILHGEKDSRGTSLAPVERVRQAVAELRRRKIDHVYVEAKGAGHTPPRKYWQDVCDWIARQRPKAWSPRPLFLPAPPARPLWKSYGDPLGLSERDDPVLSLIRAGKGRAARAETARRLREAPGNARLFVLRALSHVPALLGPFPYRLGPADFADREKGWTTAAESAAMSDLGRALHAKAGKGTSPKAFDAAARVLRAKILAKRFAVAVGAGGIGWVGAYNGAVRELRGALRLQPGHGEAVRLLRALQSRLPADLPRRQRR
jgi:poly(3-hydroxybutyrate) depolymerase